MCIVYVWHRLTRKRSFNKNLPTTMVTSLFIEIQTCGEIALPLQLTTGRSQLNPSYLMSLDFLSTGQMQSGISSCFAARKYTKWNEGLVALVATTCVVTFLAFLGLKFTNRHKQVWAGIKGYPLSTRKSFSHFPKIAAFGIWSLFQRHFKREWTYLFAWVPGSCENLC